MFGKRLFGRLIHKTLTRKFGAGHGPVTEPHVPVLYDRIGKSLMAVMFFWLFYKFKKDGLVLFGFEKPWLHEHEHVHYHPKDFEDDDDDDEEHHDEGDDEEHHEEEEE